MYQRSWWTRQTRLRNAPLPAGGHFGCPNVLVLTSPNRYWFLNEPEANKAEILLTQDESQSRVSPATRLKLSTGAYLNRLDRSESGVLLNSASGRLFNVNETALAFIQQIDGKRSISEIASQLSVEFDRDPALITDDLLAFANELIDAAVVRVLR